MIARGNVALFLIGALLLMVIGVAAQAQVAPTPVAATPDLEVQEASVRYLEALELLVFELKVVGEAGGTLPEARGALDGAPVLAYVFPTTLPPSAVGFGPVDGLLALAVTSHPDFDDTPLWDESGDGDYDNDGRIYHSHWVVLVPDERVAGGLAVREMAEGEEAILPPTHPGMPLYLDSPGLTVVLQGEALRVLVPAWRIRRQLDFSYDAVTAYLQVNASDEARPMLGVYEVYSVLSGDLSLPFEVERE